MRRIAALVAVLAAALGISVPEALAAQGPKDKDTHVQLLAINDFHGHLEPNTPGSIQVGCCNPVVNASGVQTGWAAQTVPAGGAEYLATHIKSLRTANTNTVTVGAGDLIGASPLISGLFHDEPTIHALNAIGLDVAGVGNHEFDEGLQELLRMQSGGCTAPDHCMLEPFPGAIFQYLAANVTREATGETILPAYEIRKVDNAKIAFIGLTLEGTPAIVTPTGVAGLKFHPEVQTTNALVQKLRNEQGVRAFVVLLHQGGFQNPPPVPVYPAPANPDAYTDVDRCVNFGGEEITAIAQGLSPQVDIIVSAHTHAPYICPNFESTGKLLTSASSFGRLITDIDLVIDHQTKDVKTVTADNVIVTQDVPKDSAVTAIVDRYRNASAPIANQIVGSITGDIRSSRSPGGFTSPSGEQEMGEVIADAQLEATAPTDFGGAVIALMNTGGVRGHLLHSQISGGELPGQVTYGELFTVQPFGNSLVVKTCTGAQIKGVLEQQFTATGAIRIGLLQPSNGFTYSYNSTLPTGSRVSDLRLNGTPIDPAAQYRVTMNSFLAPGGDGFTVFGECTDPLGGEIDLDALVRYFQAHSPVSPPPLNRVTKLG